MLCAVLFAVDDHCVVLLNIGVMVCGCCYAMLDIVIVAAFVVLICIWRCCYVV